MKPRMKPVFKGYRCTDGYIIGVGKDMYSAYIDYKYRYISYQESQEKYRALQNQEHLSHDFKANRFN